MDIKTVIENNKLSTRIGGIRRTITKSLKKVSKSVYYLSKKFDKNKDEELANKVKDLILKFETDLKELEKNSK